MLFYYNKKKNQTKQQLRSQSSLKMAEEHMEHERKNNHNLMQISRKYGSFKGNSDLSRTPCLILKQVFFFITNQTNFQLPHD